jgi:hypothetical protein
MTLRYLPMNANLLYVGKTCHRRDVRIIHATKPHWVTYTTKKAPAHGILIGRNFAPLGTISDVSK